ncbi:MAG: endonuclease [Paludibacteraceae bacterium]|nr:endonuclease [Paludibacteraceae bacterium]
MRKYILSFFALIITAQIGWATISDNTPTSPAVLGSSTGYYSAADGTNGSSLFSALTTISGGVTYSYTKLTYDELYTAYYTSDVYPTGHTNAGKIWDMYSTVLWIPGEKECGNYSGEGSCYNREHSMPKSWWGNSGNAYKSNNQGCDLVHLVPTDGYVNSMRSNYAFGEVASATYTSNGGLSKLGTSVNSISVSSSTISGTSVSVSGTTVFEPADEYKGDFARIYMYMRARYSSLNLAQDAGGTIHFNNTTSAANDSKYGWKDYSVILLMKWHRQDPVSQKEIDRNNAIEKMQGNRNPFVDYPILAEYLWGNRAGNTFYLANALGSFENDFIPGVSDGSKNSTDPEITSPKGTIDFGTTDTDHSVSKDITVKGINLEDGNLTLALSGSDANKFSLATTSVTKAQAIAGNVVTISYAPASEGTHTATLTISGCGVTSHTVQLTGKCSTVNTITWIDDQNQQTTTAAMGDALTLPANTPSDCSEERVFMGWTAQSTVSDEPADLFTVASGTVSGPATYHAVYADVTEEKTGGTPTWQLASSIVAGDQVVIACNTTGMTAGSLNNDVLQNVASTFSSDKSEITSLNSNTQIFTIGGSVDAWTLTSDAGLLGCTAQKKLNLSGSGATTWKITFSGGDATMLCNTTSYGSMQYNSGSPRFTTYTSSQTAIQLYKHAGGTKITYSNYSLKCDGTATNIEEVIDSVAPNAQKVLMNGQLFIIIDDHMFNVMGQQVK